MITTRRLTAGVIATVALIGLCGTAIADDTIKIGLTVPSTGAAAEVGQLQIEGAKLGVQKINDAGGIDGRKLELVIEDDQTTNPGIVLAFSRLVNRGDLAVVISSVRSTQVKALSPDAKKAGIPVFFGGSDPTLTETDNPWLFRSRPSSVYDAKSISAFGVNQLKAKKWAIIYSTDAFGSSGAAQLQKQLSALGVTPVLIQGFNNGQADLTSTVLVIRQSGADIIGSYITFENDVAVLARQVRQFGLNIPWIGSASVASSTAMKLAGPALYDTYAAADFNVEGNPEAKSYSEEFSRQFGHTADYNSAWVYDSVMLTAAAIKKAGSTDHEKIRQALLSLKDFHGAEGVYNFDKNGDGLRGVNVVQNKNGKAEFVRHIDFENQ